QWRAQFFPSSTGPIQSFATEDPGNLGIPNVHRYAFGLDPAAPDRSRLPRAVLRDGYLTMDAWRRRSATDVDYIAEVSSNLATWSSSSNLVGLIVTPEN